LTAGRMEGAESGKLLSRPGGWIPAMVHSYCCMELLTPFDFGSGWVIFRLCGIVRW